MTGDISGAGTDDDIYLGIQLKNGSKKEWKLDKNSYNDFERADNDEYYLYINDINFLPKDVNKVWIRKQHINFSMGESWYLEEVNINVNGKVALSAKPNKWIEKTDIQYFNVDWSKIVNITDPSF